ncbi:hypothetical protein A2U01_0089986 [Trifolium medium]|uniref:Uncharacterized protein n=1 Tax=Trifolium medium TaxID=97028 RepID=A0A392UAH3_9FABA|nr:hypothetical protein [Trifolium medium]
MSGSDSIDSGADIGGARFGFNYNTSTSTSASTSRSSSLLQWRFYSVFFPENKHV